MDVTCRPMMQTPERNRYFYGKLLDVYHFDLETTYFNTKRWLLNRLVLGFGVVCGLGVQLNDDQKSISVWPGVALDKCGREIIVPEISGPVDLPDVWKAMAESEAQQQQQQPDQHQHHHDEVLAYISLCYHQCEADPVPVLAGDCDTVERCAPGVIRERYKIMVKPGKAPEIPTECAISDLILGDRINYDALAKWVTDTCPTLPEDPCIPLANIESPGPDGCYDEDDIDITIRPIVYTNDLLFELLLALAARERSHPRGGKI
jgi:hypothetical protein